MKVSCFLIRGDLVPALPSWLTTPLCDQVRALRQNAARHHPDHPRAATAGASMTGPSATAATSRSPPGSSAPGTADPASPTPLTRSSAPRAHVGQVAATTPGVPGQVQRTGFPVATAARETSSRAPTAFKLSRSDRPPLDMQVAWIANRSLPSSSASCRLAKRSHGPQPLLLRRTAGQCRGRHTRRVRDCRPRVPGSAPAAATATLQVQGDQQVVPQRIPLPRPMPLTAQRSLCFSCDAPIR
jgi:hypothetical protein